MSIFKPTVSGLRKLSLLLVFLTFDLILFGAFTRLTDSGLGCPDWPGCYGYITPIGAAQHIETAQTALPTGPVTHTKAWIEMLHRYFATFVGFLIVVRLLWSFQLKTQTRESLTLPIITLVWVCIQGAFGALTVTMKLFPLIVTLHLLGGIFLLMLLTLQTDPAKTVSVPMQADSRSRKLRYWLIAAIGAVWLQIAGGGWVSTNYAVLACSEFPTCLQGQWLPATAADWLSGFTLWRELGSVSFGALTAIHLTHRVMAITVVLVLAGLMIALKPYPALRPLKLWLMGLLTLQILTGISNVVFEWPLLAAVMHTGGAAALIVVLTLIWRKTKLSFNGWFSAEQSSKTTKTGNSST
jgi:heme a synthase